MQKQTHGVHGFADQHPYSIIVTPEANSGLVGNT